MEERVEITEDIVQMFRELVYEKAGILFTGVNIPVLRSRIKEAVRKRGIDPYKLYDVLKKDSSALAEFIDSVTTNLTGFFRYRQQFDVFENEILPEIIAKREREGTKTIRLWSAGCATGEEPYTMAMVAIKVLGTKLRTFWDLKVIGSDISLKSLMKAKEGIYLWDRVKEVPDEYRERFFEKVDDEHYRISDEVKKFVTFDYHNIMYDNGLRNIDVVFCRNVLIYFDDNSQKKALDNIYITMRDDGYLFLGHSESLYGIYDRFEPIKRGGIHIYKKKV